MKESKASIGLINPKSPSNVGAVIRAVGCFQADSVFYTGERFARASQFNTDTKNMHRAIPVTGVTSLLEHVAEGARVVCIELVEGAIALPGYRHPDNAFYIFGPEDGTIGQDILDQADDVVYIPTVGCLNLAASVNVVLYDRAAKSPTSMAGNELIRRSRDANNKAKVRSPDEKLQSSPDPLLNPD